MAPSLRAMRSSPALLGVLLPLGLLACNAGPEPLMPDPQPTATALVAMGETPKPPAQPVAAPTQVPAPTAPTLAPAASAAPAAPATAPAAKGSSYVVCWCCCGGVKPRKQCLYRSKGESLDKIIADDQKPKRPCPPTMGCTMPIEYTYCD